MRKFTKSLLTLALAFIAVGGAKASYQIQLGTKYTSVGDLSGKVFAIVDETAGKAFYGPTGGYGHEVGFGVYATAFTSDVNYYYFKLVDIPADKITADPTLEGWTLIRACKADGSLYTFWGNDNNGYLNTNNDACFLLGITEKNLGQDFDFGAVWKVEYDAVNGGFSIKNKYTGKYLKDASSPKNDEPTYFSFAEVSSVEVFDEDTNDPGVAEIPEGCISLINNGTLEGTDMGSFFTKVNKGGANPSETTSGAGRFNGNGIKITSIDNAADAWDTQFWVKFNRNIPTGSKVHFEFQYRSSEATTISSQMHSQACSYVWWAGVGSVTPSINWKNFSNDVTIPKGDKDAIINVGSFALNLNDAKDKAIDFYFDNFLVYAEAKAFTVKEAGWGTFSFDKAVAFGDDVKAYTATYAAGTVTLNPVTTLAKDKGVIIEATAGTYNAVVNDGTGVTAADNDLEVSDGTVEGDGTIYVLAKKTAGVGFYKLANGEKVPAGKAYLTIPGNAPEFIGFNGTTAIETVKAAKANRGEFFNLAGQRVANPTKGLYIVNGKKVILK